MTEKNICDDLAVAMDLNGVFRRHGGEQGFKSHWEQRGLDCLPRPKGHLIDLWSL